MCVENDNLGNQDECNMVNRFMNCSNLIGRGFAVGSILVELIAPLLALMPFWEMRVLGLSSLFALVVGIATTGNYGFFHILTLAICASLLGDDLLPVASSWPAGPSLYEGSR